VGLLIFPPESQSLVGDASVWISLMASGRSDEILRAIPNACVITDIAMAELERGRARGRDTIDGVERLVAKRIVSVVMCPEVAEPTFLELVGGNAADTLDDGEACTLAYALHTNGCALIDEKKATGLAARRFPSLKLLSTVDLMLSAFVLDQLGADGSAEALYASLTGARMRVPPHCVDDVCKLLGEERARRCRSLPGRSRAAQ
jgi:predicted nucleic acid-binding protein